MALVVKNATLSSRLYEIFITPFVFMGFRIFARWWVFALLSVICVVMWATGAMQFALPKIADFKDELIIGGLCISFLWMVATILTIFDHFRFRGWTHDPGPQSVTSVTGDFLSALTRNKSEEAADFLDPRTRDKHRAHLLDWRQELGVVSMAVEANELGTVDDVIFRAMLPKLKDTPLEKDEVFVLIPMIENLDVPVGAPMKIALFLMRPEINDDIHDFKVLDMVRPELLS